MKKCKWWRVFALLLTLVLCMPTVVYAAEVEETETGETGNTGESSEEDNGFKGTFYVQYFEDTIGRYVFQLNAHGMSEEQKTELLDIAKSGTAVIRNWTDAEGGMIWFPVWVAGSPGEVYQRCEEYFSSLESEVFMTHTQWKEMIAAAEEYNAQYPEYSSDGYDAEAAYVAAKELLARFVVMPAKLEDRDAPTATGEGTITADGGKVTTSNGNSVAVKLVDEEIASDSGLYSSIATILAQNAEGYTLTGVRDIYIVRTDNDATVPINGTTQILIAYPAGYGPDDDFVVYHNTAPDQWESVTILEKTEGGILCTVNSFSPFAVAVKEAGTSENPPTDPGDSGNTSSGSNTSSSEGSGSSGNTNSGGSASAESVALADIPQTGESFSIGWLAVLAIAAIVWVMTREKKETEY